MDIGQILQSKIIIFVHYVIKHVYHVLDLLNYNVIHVKMLQIWVIQLYIIKYNNVHSVYLNVYKDSIFH